MISIGSKEMVDCQVGSKKVKEIYKGSTKSWPSWTLFYEADVRGGGNNGTTVLATIPNYVHKTTKIKVVVSYITGTWIKREPTIGRDEQAIQFGVPRNTPFIDFSADNPIHSVQYTSGNTSGFLYLSKRTSSSSERANSEWSIDGGGHLRCYIQSTVPYLLSDPVHLQVYYQ